YVLAAAGEYSFVILLSGVSVYGGYDAGNWHRSETQITRVIGQTEGIRSVGATGVALQLLSISTTGIPGYVNSISSYGIRAVNSSLTLQKLTVVAVPGGPGRVGATGRSGGNGANGAEGDLGSGLNSGGDCTESPYVPP